VSIAVLLVGAATLSARPPVRLSDEQNPVPMPLVERAERKNQPIYTI
jgi:hypothetical protein